MKVSQKQLIIEPINGLCNRLRAMASGWILAKHLARKFKVVWHATPDIGGAEFTDLFEKINWLLPQYPENFADSVVVYTAGIKTEVDVLAELCKNKSHTIVLKQTGGNYIPPGMTIERFNSLKSQFYNTLKPIPKMNLKIQAFSERYSLTDFVGVHIRRKDRKQFTPDTEMFARAIKRFDDVKGVLLCTDESTEFEKLKKLCNNKIITYPKSLFNRNTIKCVQDALVEWMLLSKCEKGIVYSHSSSFGYEACVVNKIPYTLALELRSMRQKTENEKRNLPKLVF